ncbi:MAG: hypothetical protein M5T61_12180 [Acidimicrobiia bacterium]|nr:hypothetical protein [Acidimicrobiia bacterium]
MLTTLRRSRPRSIRGPLLLFACASALAAAGCGGGGDGDSRTDAAATTTTVAASATSGQGATAPTTPDTTAVAPTTVAAGSAVVLRTDGLGVTSFGDLPEYTVAALTMELGEPTGDATEPSFSSFGTCPGTTLRAVEWDGLAVLITDGATAYGVEGGPHFFAYLYRSGGGASLVTQEGVGVGSSVADLRAAYGEALQVNAGEEGGGPSFSVGPTGPGAMYGFLEGTDDADAVTAIEAGQVCGE